MPLRHQHDVPLAEHSALFLDHDGVQECRAREPGQEARILDRIPRPVPAPAQLDIRPPHAERDADGQEEPGDERPPPDDAQPLRIEPAGDQRRDRESERDRRRDVAEIEIRRMDRHPRVLELRIHPAPVGRHEAQPVIGIGLEARRRDEEDENHRERAAGPRREIASLVTNGADGHRRIAGQDQRPEQHRARLATPERGEDVHLRHVRAGVRRHVLEREVVRQQGGPETDRGEDDHRRGGVQPAPAAGDQVFATHRAARERRDGRPRGHEQRDPQRQLTDEDHARAPDW
jgi:hypothetical protein